MAVAASLLRSEMRRHLLMNLGLVASCVAGGTVVTNERGLFVPLGIHSMSETAKAFAAMFTPSHLLPGFTNVQMVTPLEPFDVTADSRDLRRRLMEDWAGDFTAPATDAENQANDLAQYAGPTPTLTPTELADSGPRSGVRETQSDSSSGGSGSGGSSSSSTTGSGDPGGASAQSTGNAASGGTSSPFSKSTTGDMLASNQQNSNTEMGSSTPPNGGGNTAPVPEPSMWAMLLAGFGAVGYILRTSRRRRGAMTDAEAA